MNNPKSVDIPDQKPALKVVLDTFKECYDRSFQQVGGAPIPEPNPEKDLPLDLQTYQEAIQTIDLDISTLQKSMDKLIVDVEKADLKSLANKFPAGQKFCLNIVPFYSSGVPSADLQLCQVTAKGLTFGPTGDPAYYFLNFPTEIQQNCSFKVPLAEIPRIYSPELRQEIKQSLLNAWTNLLNILELQKNNQKQIPLQ